MAAFASVCGFGASSGGWEIRSAEKLLAAVMPIGRGAVGEIVLPGLVVVHKKPDLVELAARPQEHNAGALEEPDLMPA
ncbi:hypothetical protein ACNIUX_27015, partial [Escherichia coli]